MGMLDRAFKKAHQMMLRPRDWPYEEKVRHVQRCMGVRKAFYELTRHFYTLQVPCDRTSAHCDAKRTADGGRNHTHALELEFPEPDYGDYGTAAGLRREVLVAACARRYRRWRPLLAAQPACPKRGWPGLARSWSRVFFSAVPGCCSRRGRWVCRAGCTLLCADTMRVLGGVRAAMLLAAGAGCWCWVLGAGCWVLGAAGAVAGAGR